MCMLGLVGLVGVVAVVALMGVVVMFALSRVGERAADSTSGCGGQAVQVAWRPVTHAPFAARRRERQVTATFRTCLQFRTMN